MGDFTNRLTQRRVLNRTEAPPVDLDELRKQTPGGGLKSLLTQDSCEAIATLDPKVAKEVGTLLVAMGDALSRVCPPALRLDIKMVSQGWVLEVLNNGQLVYSRTSDLSPETLCKLAIDGVAIWAHFAADADSDPKKRTAVYNMWSREMADQAMKLEEWGVRITEGRNISGHNNYCSGN